MEMIEQVEMKFDDKQNEELEKMFQDFYKLDSAPKIKRKLIVPKDSFKSFLKSRTKQRTQFQAREDEIDMKFSSSKIPFVFTAVHTEFIMPSGESALLFEELDAPCGLTKNVSYICGDVKKDFDSYFQAELEVLTKFKEF